MFLGIDGGGTKTKVAVTDEKGNLLYEGKGGPSNHLVVGVEGMVNSVKEALLSFEYREFDAVVAGIGGAGFERELNIYLAKELGKVVKSKKIEVRNDCYIATIGAIGRRKKGMIVLSGTGSMIIGIDENRKHYKAGGWGHLLGDEGSGFRISYDAIRSVMSYWEGMGPATALEGSLREHFGLSTITDVVNFFYIKKAGRKKVASFAPHVINTAEKGDFVARIIIEENVEKLLKGVGPVKRGIKDDYISYAGGVFTSSYYKKIVKEKLRILGFELREPVLTPIGGALLMSFEMIGILSDEVMENLKNIK